MPKQTKVRSTTHFPQGKMHSVSVSSPTHFPQGTSKMMMQSEGMMKRMMKTPKAK